MNKKFIILFLLLSIQSSYAGDETDDRDFESSDIKLNAIYSKDLAHNLGTVYNPAFGGYRVIPYSKHFENIAAEYKVGSLLSTANTSPASTMLVGCAWGDVLPGAGATDVPALLYICAVQQNHAEGSSEATYSIVIGAYPDNVITPKNVSVKLNDTVAMSITRTSGGCLINAKVYRNGRKVSEINKSFKTPTGFNANFAQFGTALPFLGQQFAYAVPLAPFEIGAKITIDGVTSGFNSSNVAVQRLILAANVQGQQVNEYGVAAYHTADAGKGSSFKMSYLSSCPSGQKLRCVGVPCGPGCGFPVCKCQ